MLSVADDRREAYRPLVDFVAELITDRRPAFTVLPFYDEMASRVADGGAEALLEMPHDYWVEIGAIGTIDEDRGTPQIIATDPSQIHTE